MTDRPTAQAAQNPIVRYAGIGQRAIASVLLVLMFLVVVATTLRLGVDAVAGILGADFAISDALLTEERLFAVLGLFLAVLISLELLETVVVYFTEHSLHAEVVVLVALVALARKIVLLELDDYQPLAIIGLGLLTLALGGTYFLLKYADSKCR